MTLTKAEKREIVEKAIELMESHKPRAKKALARNVWGDSCGVSDPYAIAFCSFGALLCVSNDDFCCFSWEGLKGEIARINDSSAPDSEVYAAMRKLYE